MSNVATMERPGLRTERDVVETLAGRAITMAELYAAVEAAGVHERNDGTKQIPGFGTDRVWRRRVRGCLQTLKKEGRAHRIGNGTWVIDGDRDAPQRAMLIVVPGLLGGADLGLIEMQLADAEEYMDRLAADGIEVDLVLGDPPYALNRGEGDACRGRGERTYARDHTKVLRGGYVEVDEGAYTEFTYRWVGAAARLLAGRPGGYLAVVTGPQQAARIQCAAEDAGLTFLNQVVAERTMAVYNRSPRRFSHGHYVVTICCNGKPTSKRRFFHVVPELPTAASGLPYPRTWWAREQVGRADRNGLLRYDNHLPVPLVSQVIRSLTPGPDSGHSPWTAAVVDPMMGGGTTAVACLTTQRRFYGADLNPEAVRFSMARLTKEHCDA